MKRAVICAVALAVTATSPLLAQSAKKKRDRRRVQQQQPYAQMFTLRGIEFSSEQQAKVGEIRKKYVPMLIEMQREQNGVFTNEQRRARQQAFRSAREAGKNAQEARQAADAAANLTDEQKKRLATALKERIDLQAEIRSALQSLLTAEQRTQLRRQGNRNAPRRSANPPTHANVKYGPYERNVMDVWLAKSEKPAPVLMSIHGGGFRGGNKSVSPGLRSQCLAAGISVAAITYRLSDEAIAPAQFLDSARAIQFVRYKANEWNLDPTRIASTGGSAGAGLSLWLGFHDDLADPNNADPVLRQSTRLTCMAVYNGQTSYDPRVIRDLFPGTDTYKHSALAQLYDVNLDKLDELPDTKYRLFEEVSALPHLGKGDAPALLIYNSDYDTPIRNQGVGIHHPRFGKVLKAEMDKLGIECKVQTGIGRNNDESTKLTMDFIKKHLRVE